MERRRSSAEKHLNLDFDGNRHPAKMAAHRVFHQTKEGRTTLVHKTLQAGATTGTIAACLDAKEFFCLIGSTRKNVNEVMKKSIKYSDRKELSSLADLVGTEGEGCIPVRTLPTKLDCPYVKAEINACPDKAKIPIFFGDCRQCGDAEHCGHYQYLLNGGNDDDEGIGITMAALRAALHSEKRDRLQQIEDEAKLSWGSLKLRQIRRKAKVFIIDECHELEVPETKRVTVVDVTNTHIYNFKSIYAAVLENSGVQEAVVLDGELAGYGILGEKTIRYGPYGYVAEVIENFNNFINSSEMLEAIGSVRERTQNKKHERELLTAKVKNPYRLDLDDPTEVGRYVAVIDELHQMFVDINSHRLDLNIDQVVDLLYIFYCACAEFVTIQMYTDAGNEWVDVVAIDYEGEKMLKDFLKERLDAYHRGIMLSATPSDFRYTGLTDNGKVSPMFFNSTSESDENRGDPTNSCDRQLLIADTFKFQHRGSRSLHNRMEHVITAIKRITDVHGWKNCAVVGKSKREIEVLKSEMKKRCMEVAVTDYYRSPDALATTYEYEEKHFGKVMKTPIHVGILIGAAEIPSHSMDAVSKSAEESTRKRIANVYQATYQTTGRFKSSCGLPSVVYCLGIKPKELENFTTWGTEYAIVDAGTRKDRYSVNVKKAVARPSLYFAEDLEDMILAGSTHMGIEEIEKNFSEQKRKIVRSPRFLRSPLEKWVLSSYAGDDEKRLCEMCAQPDCLYYIYKLSLDSFLLLSFGMTTLHAGKNECMRDTLCVKKWGAIDFWPTLTHKHDSINSGKGTATGTEKDHANSSVTQHHESECSAPDPIARRLGTWEQNYPIEDLDQLTGHPIDADYPMVATQYTSESWETWQAHLDEQIGKIKVGQGWYCDNPMEFMYNTFRTRPDLIYKQVPVNEFKMGYNAIKRSPYFPESEEVFWLWRHLTGGLTLGMPCIDDNGNVHWGCYDIDAHPRPDDTGVTIIKKRYLAETKMYKLLAYLHEKGIPYILEESGSTSSYHIWISVAPIDAGTAMWFFRSLALAAGVIDIEVNPKQAKAGAKGSGNQVKLPWGTHRLHGGKSRLYIGGEFVRAGDMIQNKEGFENNKVPYFVRSENYVYKKGDFIDIMHRQINICDIDINAPKLMLIRDIPRNEPVLIENGVEFMAMESVTYTGSKYPGIRDFFAWLLDQDLSGPEGHAARLYVVREFANAGWSPEDIAWLMSKQSDFNYEVSLDAVRSIISQDFGNIKYETLWRDCPILAEKYEAETGRSLDPT